MFLFCFHFTTGSFRVSIDGGANGSSVDDHGEGDNHNQGENFNVRSPLFAICENRSILIFRIH